MLSLSLETAYAATFGGKDALAGLVEAEYLRRGGDHFRQVVAPGGECLHSSLALRRHPNLQAPIDCSENRRPSAPSSPACTGPSMAPKTSSTCAASAPAAGGTSSGPPSQPARPGSGRPSDRHRNSDPAWPAAGQDHPQQNWRAPPLTASSPLFCRWLLVPWEHRFE